MSARMAKQKNGVHGIDHGCFEGREQSSDGITVKAIPKSSGLDELDDYIRYQDEVLDRNALELIGVVEAQEEKLRLLQQDQDRRMQRLYEKENQMDTLDEELQKLIQKTDEKMGEWLVVMDNKTDDYMKDLARRNAQWSYRLKEVDKNITHSARAKSNVIWEERQGQKEINKDYQPSHTLRETEGEVPGDAEAIVVEEGPQGSGGAVVEVRGEKIIADAPQVQEQIRKSSPSQRPVQRKKRPPQTQRKPVQQKRTPQYKVQVPQAGKATPQTIQPTQSTPSRGSGPKSYPCPTCQNDLVYYDKYQRWWCRSCKKWR